MAVQEFNIAEIKRKMQSSIGVLKTEFTGLRTGRASPALLDPIMVEAYGSKMALKEVATVSVPESRLLSVQVWDKGLAPAVDKAIRESNLGLNPMLEGAVLRIPIPELSKDRRQELVKAAQRYAEAAKVAIRHVRRDGMDHLKKLEKDAHKSEDEIARLSEHVQKATDEAIADVDKLLVAKEKDVMQV